MGPVWVRAAALFLLAAAACEPCPYQVIAEVTVQLDDAGPAPVDAGAGGVYCATPCAPGSPCAGGEYCSQVLNPSDGSPWGLCFKNR